MVYIYPMMKLPDKCPVCGGEIIIERFRCRDCGVSVEGAFTVPRWGLTQEQWDFIRLFLKVRGNLKEMERIMGLSYPTVRARLESVRRALGFSEVEDIKSEVLSALERGEITVEEALEKLEKEEE